MYCISSLKVARLAITVVEINSVTVFQVHEQSWNLKLRPELRRIFDQVCEKSQGYAKRSQKEEEKED